MTRSARLPGFQRTNQMFLSALIRCIPCHRTVNEGQRCADLALRQGRRCASVDCGPHHAQRLHRCDRSIRMKCEKESARDRILRWTDARSPRRSEEYLLMTIAPVVGMQDKEAGNDSHCFMRSS